MVEVAAPLLGVTLAAVGLAALGRWAAADVRGRSRCVVRFKDVRFEPAPPERRDEFLREVQYEAELPDTLDRFDANLAARLRDAFARHAWVEEVERVEVRPGGPVRVRLRYRTPVLAVPGREQVRVVDRSGVLLPRAAVPSGLPMLRGDRLRRGGPTGTAWADARVQAAARTAGFLQPQGERLRLSALEYRGGEIVLWTADGSRILWGNPPGGEATGEATAVLKRDRLLLRLDHLAEAGQAEEAYEHDLRPATGALLRPLPETVQVGAR